MNVSPALLRHQGPMLSALGRVAIAAMKKPPTRAMETPGAWVSETVPARSNELVDAYVEWCGADPARYRDTIPAHMFPQWGFPLITETLKGIPYKLTGVLNQGTHVEVKGPIPRNVPLRLKARLEALDDDGYKARIHQRLITGTDENPELLITDVFAVIVHKRKQGQSERAEETVNWKEIGEFSAGRWDGLQFGILTGDMNPIHWVPPYAKVAGFKRQILHGFASFARSWETVVSSLGKDIPEADVRFVRPMVLPATVKVELESSRKKQRQIRLTDASGKVYMAGSLTVK